MRDFLYAILIALSNNVDNITARIAFSIKGIKISNPINLWISVITFLISSVSAYTGGLLLGAINGRICSYISMALLVCMGTWILADPILKRRRKRHDDTGLAGIMDNPENADINRSKDIDFKEATLLGIALSINNIGGSLSAGMIGVNIWLIGGLSALINFIALWAGNRLAVFLERFKIGEKAAYIAGAILILIGIKQIL